MMNTSSPFAHFATEALHVGQEPEQWPYHDVIPPISMTTTYKQTGPAEHKGFDYARSGNPTRMCLEKSIAALEAGDTCVCYPSGLSAIAAIVSMLQTGDHIVCSDDVFGGTNQYLRTIASKSGIKATLVDMTDLDAVEKAIQPNITKLMWIETPTNPLLKVVDIAEMVKIAKVHNLITVVDNSFMSPYFQRPLALGADIVMHSITKYINGHSDVLMGCAVTSNENYAKSLKYFQFAGGATPSPFDSFLVNRGIKTLHIRMERHMTNAKTVAEFLEKHPQVGRVFYPELKSHPQHAVHKKQSNGMSGIVSFYVKGGLKEASIFLKTLKVFTLAHSVGGVESLANHPALMTHASVPKGELKKLGIDDNLIRLSVGLEDIDDLIDDLDKALNATIASNG